MNWPIDLAYAAGWRGVRALPPRVAHDLFRRGADRAVRGDGARQLRANLARLVPGADLDELVRDGMRSYARYWCEVFRLPSMDHSDVHRRTVDRGSWPLLDAAADGRPVVLAITHSGNWDAAGVWLVQTLRALGREPSFTTVTARLAPESLFRRFVDYRSSLGFEVVAAGDDSTAYRALTRRLRGGGVVCLVSDLDISRSGVDVTLCGEPARLPGGAARLAAMTGALLLPVVPSFSVDGWVLDFGAPVPVPDRAAVGKATQGLADAFGAMLARVPADWHMLQAVWDVDRAGTADRP